MSSSSSFSDKQKIAALCYVIKNEVSRSLQLSSDFIDCISKLDPHTSHYEKVGIALEFLSENIQDIVTSNHAAIFEEMMTIICNCPSISQVNSNEEESINQVGAHPILHMYVVPEKTPYVEPAPTPLLMAKPIMYLHVIPAETMYIEPSPLLMAKPVSLQKPRGFRISSKELNNATRE